MIRPADTFVDHRQELFRDELFANKGTIHQAANSASDVLRCSRPSLHGFLATFGTLFLVGGEVAPRLLDLPAVWPRRISGERLPERRLVACTSKRPAMPAPPRYGLHCIHHLFRIKKRESSATVGHRRSSEPASASRTAQLGVLLMFSYRAEHETVKKY
jgi:hypothetical protein